MSAARIAWAVALAATAVACAPAAGRTVWLCRPGLAHDPCTSDLTATVVGPQGTRGVERVKPDPRAPVDCFYVYPTVSNQQTTNANLHVDPEERNVAVLQASRFSQVCRVFAPMYPQLTRHAILTGGITAQGVVTALNGLKAAFRDYLAHRNHGRGIVFVGHSQGASMLIALLRQEVDPKPALRRRVVSALLLGGQLTVPAGKRVGGAFEHIPTCRSASETGCAVAYSSFAEEPPADAFFGRVGGGLNPFAPTDAAGLRIACVNPAAPRGGRGWLLTYLRGSGGTPWVAYPHEYRARCRAADGATWLQVDRPGGAADGRPAVGEYQGPRWGLHVFDVNLAIGNLVALVRSEARAYRVASRGRAA